MKTLTIKLTKGTETIEQTVKSECAMWNALRKIRDEITDADLTDGVRAVVTDADGKPFKDITFRKNSKGKIEMPNAVKETNRIRTKKSDVITLTKKAAEEAAVKSFKAKDLALSGTTTAEMKDVLAEAQEMAAAVAD